MWRFIDFGSVLSFLALAFVGWVLLLAALGSIRGSLDKRWHPLVVKTSTLLFLLVAALTFTYHVIAPASKEYRRVGPFLGHISEYASIGSKRVDRILNRSSLADSIPSRKSRKVIVIDPAGDLFGPKIDPLFFDLPADVRATRPEEVGTVVILLKSTKRVGTYSDSKGVEEPALTPIWEVDIYDEPTGQLLSHSSSEGGSPSQVKRKGDSGVGGSPTFGVENSIISFYRNGL